MSTNFKFTGYHRRQFIENSTPSKCVKLRKWSGNFVRSPVHDLLSTLICISLDIHTQPLNSGQALIDPNETTKSVYFIFVIVLVSAKNKYTHTIWTKIYTFSQTKWKKSFPLFCANRKSVLPECSLISIMF